MGLILHMVSTVFRVVEVIIVLDCLMSWIIQDRSNEIKKLINNIASPILEPFRQIQYKYISNIPVDISPIFAIIAIKVIERLLYMVF